MSDIGKNRNQKMGQLSITGYKRNDNYSDLRLTLFIVISNSSDQFTSPSSFRTLNLQI